MTQRMMRFVWIAVLGALYVQPASAQFSSAIEGTVTDNTSAVVPGAKVTVTNVNTGLP